MHYSSSILAVVALVSSVNAHGVIVQAVGEQGASQGFLVDQTLARNCTNISPCQQDSTIIRDSEITQNIVNSCGRTEIAGNIDVGEQTEAELAAGRMTTVTKGSKLAVTIHQVNADGAGPYECELDETSNAATNFVKLQVANNVPGANGLSDAKEQNFTVQVTMPDDFNCIGASTGDICTVRCRNTAVAGPFGGCFAVQQTDGTGRTDNSASGVETAQTLQGISAQILQNQKDLPIAIAANQAVGAAEAAVANKDNEAGIAAISALLAANPAAGATSTSAAASATQAAGGNGKGNGNGNGNKNNGNQNQNAGGNQNQNQAGGNQNQNQAGGNQNQNAGGNANGNKGGNGQQAGNGNGRGNNKKRSFSFFS
ncbi:unnamed protein product [Periconia digitata]|uniref:GEgh 16 protein n=1 Tax=Periconia digitata TaxID=1303443 RepID=A0A9W4U519_9PLEO|nr:unnamed protein product [Periconia digitata]